MKLWFKNTCVLLLLAGIFVATTGCNRHSNEPREHRRMWWRFGLKKHRDAYNPYVNSRGKTTKEISRREKRADDKAIKRAKKEYQKGIKRSARKRRGK